jgi:hypothetical protein
MPCRWLLELWTYGGIWVVRRGGKGEPVSEHTTEAEAEAVGRELADKENAVFQLYGRIGRHVVREEGDTYQEPVGDEPDRPVTDPG